MRFDNLEQGLQNITIKPSSWRAAEGYRLGVATPSPAVLKHRPASSQNPSDFFLDPAGVQLQQGSVIRRPLSPLNMRMNVSDYHNLMLAHVN